MPIPISIHCRGDFMPWCRPVLPWALPLVLSLVLACEGDNFESTLITDPKDVFWELELNHHAVTLSTTAPYDTLTLVATPRNYLDEPLTGLPAPTYTSSSPDVVLVTNEGLLVGLKPTSGTSLVNVVATVVSTNIKHVDTVAVRVVNNPTPPVLASFSIQPVPPDSAKTAAIGNAGNFFFNFDEFVAVGRRIPLRATDAAGASILSGLVVWCRSANPTVASLGAIFTLSFISTTRRIGVCGNVMGNRPGMTEIYASMTAYGVLKTDTLLYRIGWPLMEAVNVGPGAQGEGNIFGQHEIRIGPGGLVYWTGGALWYQNFGTGGWTEIESRFGLPKTTTPTEIVFDDPTNVLAYNPSNVLTAIGRNQWCGVGVGGANCDLAGDIMLDSAGVALRRFPVPGTYVYRNPLNGAQGRIIVSDN